jgi:hypothetical protein
MAKTRNNMLLYGFSGPIGNDMYLRICDGIQILCKKPKKKEGRIPPPQEIERRHRFTRAELYAREIIKNEAIKKRYEAKRKPLQRAYNLALSDASIPPRIHKIDTGEYHGRPGDILSVEATDNFGVERVFFRIESADGNLLEEGFAVQEWTETDWTYTTSRNNEILRGTKIRVYAEDLPENRTSMEIVIG